MQSTVYYAVIDDICDSQLMHLKWLVVLVAYISYD